MASLLACALAFDSWCIVYCQIIQSLDTWSVVSTRQMTLLFYAIFAALVLMFKHGLHFFKQLLLHV